MARDFGGMKARLAAFENSANAIVTSKGMQQIQAMQAVDPLKVQGLLRNASMKVGDRMHAMLISNASTAGLKGQMLTFMSQAKINAQPGKVTVFLPDGLKFKDGKGDVYAAAGAFTFGAVRQPMTKAAGSLYKDLSTGQMRPRAKAAGDFGGKAKRSIKAHVLHGAPLSARQGKAAKAIAGGKVSVIAPKFPFFRTTPGQDTELQALWVEAVKESLAQAGIETL